MDALISIIVPVYNTQEYIEKCLDSILNQTYKNIEIIVVNDGSFDESKNIIEKMQKSDSRIKLINQKNSGVSVARNVGIKNSKGSYITFVDSDDYVEINYIEELYKCIKKTNSEIAICNFVINNGKHTDTCEIKEFDSKTAIINMLLAKYYDSSVCCKIIKSELARKEEFSRELLIAEDMLFYYNLFSKCKKISYIDKTCHHYMQNSNGAISTLSNEKVDNLKIFDKLITNCNDEDIKEALCSKYVSTCFHCLSLNLSKVTTEYIQFLKETIKKYRFKILLKKNINFKVKMASIISIFGFKIVTIIMNMKRSR